MGGKAGDNTSGYPATSAMAQPGLPLDAIAEEHFHARRICALIEKIASARSLDRGAVKSVLRFLNEDLSDHMRDEAQDIFPLLLRRCQKDYGIEQTLERIAADQAQAVQLLPEVRSLLSRCLDAGQAPSQAEAAVLLRFATHTRRHILAENAILLPLARAHLTRRDLSRLARRMRDRRGAPPSSEKTDA